jgi:membrane protease YdiL (CAAX protease family)
VKKYHSLGAHFPYKIPAGSCYDPHTMKKTPTSITQPAFQPWPAFGYGIAAYFGSVILSGWILGILSPASVNEAIDPSTFTLIDITPEIAHYYLQVVGMATVMGSAMVYYLTRSRLGAQTDTYLGLIKIPWVQIRPWLGLSVVFVFAGQALVYLAGQAMEDPLAPHELSLVEPSLLLIVVIVVAIPMWEELVFRSFIFTGLQNSTMANSRVVTICAAVWALLHVDFYGQSFLITMCFGIALGLARLRHGSVLLPMAMHAVYGGTYMLFAQLAS